MLVGECNLTVEPIIIGEKTFTLKRRLQWGEVNEIRDAANKLMSFSEKYKDKKVEDLTQEDFAELSKKLLSSQTSEQQLMANILIKCLGYAQEQLNELDYQDAVIIFNELYTQSTTPKKKSSQPYA